jgi:hypothetical protein
VGAAMRGLALNGRTRRATLRSERVVFGNQGNHLPEQRTQLAKSNKMKNLILPTVRENSHRSGLAWPEWRAKAANRLMSAKKDFPPYNSTSGKSYFRRKRIHWPDKVQIDTYARCGLPVLFLMAIFAQALFTLVSGNFVTFTFFSARHTLK